MNMQMFSEILAAIVIFIILAIYIGWQIKKKGLRPFAIDMIIKAEDMFEKGKNDEKMNFVISKIKEIIGTTLVGKILMHFITDNMIQNFIQSIFDGLKKALDYRP